MEIIIDKLCALFYSLLSRRCVRQAMTKVGERGRLESVNADAKAPASSLAHSLNVNDI
jgi:hypothetical protein